MATTAPALACTMLSLVWRWLLRWAELAVDRPWTPRASRKIDHLLTRREAVR